MTLSYSSVEQSPLEESSGFLSQVFLTLSPWLRAPPGPYLKDPVLVGEVPFASGNGAGSLEPLESGCV